VRTAVCLQGVDPPDVFEGNVAAIERLGFDQLWLTDSSLHTRNCWSYLTLAARVSAGLTLGTAVTNPLTRHPGVTAAAAATLGEVSAGRFVLGIGAGDRPLLAMGHTPARLADLEAAIVAIRRLWRGEHVSMRAGAFGFEDAHYRFAPAEHSIPVWVSATGPRTLELAGRIADGVIVLAGLHPDGIRFALEHIDRGADQAGRTARPPVTVFAYGAIDDENPAAAFDAARTIAAWFPQTSPVYCELAGLPADLVAAVRTRYSGGEFQEAAAAADLLPAEFVRRMALAGDSTAACAHLRDLAELGIDQVTVFPLGPNRMQTVARFADCAARTLPVSSR
jgi:5,10-methylenetetrahydromethanopterin reductase